MSLSLFLFVFIVTSWLAHALYLLLVPFCEFGIPMNVYQVCTNAFRSNEARRKTENCFVRTLCFVIWLLLQPVRLLRTFRICFFFLFIIHIIFRYKYIYRDIDICFHFLYTHTHTKIFAVFLAFCSFFSFVCMPCRSCCCYCYCISLVYFHHQRSDNEDSSYSFFS